MFGIGPFLHLHGLTLHDVGCCIRPVQPGESLLLVGSVAEGLAKASSDLDLILLQTQDQPSPNDEAIVRALPGLFDLNLEIISAQHLRALTDRFRLSLHALTSSSTDIFAIEHLTTDDLRLLHRLSTGLPLQDTEPDLLAFRRCHRFDQLPQVSVLIQAACHLKLRVDVEAALAAGDEPDSLRLISQLAAQHLLAAMLASTGETNPTVKWLVRLANDRRHGLRHFHLDAVIDLLLGRGSPGILADLSAYNLSRLADGDPDISRALAAMGARYAPSLVDA